MVAWAVHCVIDSQNRVVEFQRKKQACTHVDTVLMESGSGVPRQGNNGGVLLATRGSSLRKCGSGGM